MIVESPITRLVCKYRKFNVVFRKLGKKAYDPKAVRLIAGSCDLPKREVRRQLLYRYMIGVINTFDYFQEEEVRKQHLDIYTAYEDCILTAR